LSFFGGDLRGVSKEIESKWMVTRGDCFGGNGRGWREDEKRGGTDGGCLTPALFVLNDSKNVLNKHFPIGFSGKRYLIVISYFQVQSNGIWVHEKKQISFPYSASSFPVVFLRCSE